MRRIIIALLAVVVSVSGAWSQISTESTLTELSVSSPREYEIGGIIITGSRNLDNQVITLISGLQVGDKITLPGETITKAIKNLWRQKLFDDVGIYVTEVKGSVVFLEIRLKELPKLSKYGIKGLPKSKQNDIREELDLNSGAIVTENLLIQTKNTVKNYYQDKGYLNVKVDVVSRPDTSRGNSVIMVIHIDKGEKVKIQDIRFHGNTVTKVEGEHMFDLFNNTEGFSDLKLRKLMKETKRKSLGTIFKSSKFNSKNYKEDKKAIIDKYNTQGYRDARILNDSVTHISDNRVVIDIYLEEGRKYYFRDITWLGNSKYTSEQLSRILRIKKGEVYDADYLQERLFMDPNGGDISSLYLDNGYLFFDVNPVEILVENDSIDFEMRLREGREATIRSVTVVGNDRTNDHVIMRELRTRPGDLFRRSDIQRSLRELQQLGFFEPTELNVNPQPNAETGTVDIEYSVVERSTSQLELQGGWGAGTIVGTLGLNFNNFSARNMFKKGAWKPLPSGDGQTINLRAQSNGVAYQSYSISFTEPWLGGKKPTSLTVSLYHNIQNSAFARSDPNFFSLKTTGVTVGLGFRLKWPDDYFTLYTALDFQRYKLKNYTFSGNGILFPDDNIYNIAGRITLGRNSTDYPIYPRRGSLFNITLEATLPYSLMRADRNYDELPAYQRYEYLEYYKWKFNSAWFVELLNKLVVKTGVDFGFLGAYNDELGIPPFERFYMGGSGLQNFVLDGREVVALRGYPDNTIFPEDTRGIPGVIYNKFTLELRYLITENPSAQIFTLGFLEAGNTYSGFDNYQPFELKRSAGFGVRIFMPMFGLLGIDFGYGFDPIPGYRQASGWNTHFIIGQQF